MAYSFDIIIIREASTYSSMMLVKSLKDIFFDGVCIDVNKVYAMINKTYTASAIGNEYLKAVESSVELINSFIQSRYSPIIIVGSISLEMMEILKMSFFHNSVFTISSYADNKTFLEEFISQKDRDRSTYVSTKDTLIRYKKRRIGNINLEIEAKMNFHICDTKHKTDFQINRSTMSYPILAKTIIKLVKE